MVGLFVPSMHPLTAYNIIEIYNYIFWYTMSYLTLCVHLMNVLLATAVTRELGSLEVNEAEIAQKAVREQTLSADYKGGYFTDRV